MLVANRAQWRDIFEGDTPDTATYLDLGKIQLFGFGGLDDSEVSPGYVIHQDARGKGVVTEALRAVVEWTFRPAEQGGFGKRRITISTAASNKASRYAAERAGFTHIATIPTGFTIGTEGFEDGGVVERARLHLRPLLMDHVARVADEFARHPRAYRLR